MKRQYFGTDGVRGPYGGPVINESFAARLGAAAGRWIGSALATGFQSVADRMVDDFVRAALAT